LITDNWIYNQDDCLAINSGSNITFQRNTCIGGHGVSIVCFIGLDTFLTSWRRGLPQGSISSDATVSNIKILNNTIIDNDQALRIKTKVDAMDASVVNVTYSGNTSRGNAKFGVLIDQSYPSTVSTPGNGVIIQVCWIDSFWFIFVGILSLIVENVNFVGAPNVIEVNSTAKRVTVNCGTRQLYWFHGLHIQLDASAWVIKLCL
jgi:polygalacturonase